MVYKEKILGANVIGYELIDLLADGLGLSWIFLERHEEVGGEAIGAGKELMVE